MGNAVEVPYCQLQQFTSLTYCSSRIMREALPIIVSIAFLLVGVLHTATGFPAFIITTVV